MLSRNFQFISIIKYWNCALEIYSFIYSINNYLINMYKGLCLDTEDTRQIPSCFHGVYILCKYAMHTTFALILWQLSIVGYR